MRVCLLGMHDMVMEHLIVRQDTHYLNGALTEHAVACMYVL